MMQLVFYVPESHLAAVKQAVFNAGAGRLGAYDHCAWQVMGQGQFRPLDGSKPYVGRHNQDASVAEYRVEVICGKTDLSAVIAALKSAHPYEMPAYSVWELVEC